MWKLAKIGEDEVRNTLKRMKGGSDNTPVEV